MIDVKKLRMVANFAAGKPVCMPASELGELLGRLEAAERERDEWQRIAHTHHECEEHLAKKRDALAAHVERLTPLVGHVLEQFERDARGEPMESDEDALAWADRAQSAVKDTPTTSLARLKAQWQAEALEEVLALAEGCGAAGVVNALRCGAASKRRQSERGD